MNKTLLRIASFLLIPCLVGDPVTAAGFGGVLAGLAPRLVVFRSPCQQATCIQEQALSSVSLPFLRKDRLESSAPFGFASLLVAHNQNAQIASSSHLISGHWYSAGHLVLYLLGGAFAYWLLVHGLPVQQQVGPTDPLKKLMQGIKAVEIPVNGIPRSSHDPNNPIARPLTDQKPPIHPNGNGHEPGESVASPAATARPANVYIPEHGTHAHEATASLLLADKLKRLATHPQSVFHDEVLPDYTLRSSAPTKQIFDQWKDKPPSFPDAVKGISHTLGKGDLELFAKTLRTILNGEGGWRIGRFSPAVYIAVASGQPLWAIHRASDGTLQVQPLETYLAGLNRALDPEPKEKVSQDNPKAVSAPDDAPPPLPSPKPVPAQQVVKPTLVDRIAPVLYARPLPTPLSSENFREWYLSNREDLAQADWEAQHPGKPRPKGYFLSIRAIASALPKDDFYEPAKSYASRFGSALDFVLNNQSRLTQQLKKALDKMPDNKRSLFHTHRTAFIKALQLHMKSNFKGSFKNLLDELLRVDYAQETLRQYIAEPSNPVAHTSQNHAFGLAASRSALLTVFPRYSGRTFYSTLPVGLFIMSHILANSSAPGLHSGWWLLAGTPIISLILIKLFFEKVVARLMPHSAPQATATAMILLFLMTAVPGAKAQSVMKTTFVSPSSALKSASSVPIEGLIQANAKRYDIDPSLLRSIISSESSFDPSAESTRGALGLMQLMSPTAREIADRIGLIRFADFKDEDLKNPLLSVRLGSRYLYELFKRYNGDLLTVLAAYNAGPGIVEQWMNGKAKLEESDIRYPDTLRYVRNVMATYAYLKAIHADSHTPIHPPESNYQQEALENQRITQDALAALPDDASVIVLGFQEPDGSRRLYSKPELAELVKQNQVWYVVGVWVKRIEEGSGTSDDKQSDPASKSVWGFLQSIHFTQPPDIGRHLFEKSA